MNIEQLKIKKAEVEKQIQDLISNFSQETRLIVEGVNCVMTDISIIGHPRQTQCSSVEMEIRLD